MRAKAVKPSPEPMTGSMSRIDRFYAHVKQAVEELGDYANDAASIDEVNAAIASIVKLEDIARRWKSRTRWRDVS